MILLCAVMGAMVLAALRLLACAPAGDALPLAPAPPPSAAPVFAELRRMTAPDGEGTGPADDCLVIVYDDSTAAPPLVDLRDEGGASGWVQIVVDGVVIASLPRDIAPAAQDLLVMGHSKARAAALA